MASTGMLQQAKCRIVCQGGRVSEPGCYVAEVCYDVHCALQGSNTACRLLDDVCASKYMVSRVDLACQKLSDRSWWTEVVRHMSQQLILQQASWR